MASSLLFYHGQTGVADSPGCSQDGSKVGAFFILQGVYHKAYLQQDRRVAGLAGDVVPGLLRVGDRAGQDLAQVFHQGLGKGQ